MRQVLSSDVWRRPVSEVPELWLAVVAVAALVSAGFAFSIPVVVFAALGVAVTVAIAVVHARLGGGGWQLHVRLGVEVLALSVLMYATGWGAALSLLLVFAVADALRTAGSGSARAALGWCLGALALGQWTIHAGLVPSLIAAPEVHGVAVLGALALIAVVRRMTRMMVETEDARAEVGRSEQRFRALVREAADVVFVIDRRGIITYQSPAASWFNFRDDELVGRQFQSILDEADQADCRAQLAHMVTSGAKRDLSAATLLSKDGRRVPVETSWRNALDDAAVQGIVLTVRDVTERRRLEAEIQHRAFHDGLTDLANRDLFRDRLDHVTARARRRPQTYAVLFLDLDGFKHVNDSLGHDAGDALLVEVAERLSFCVRDADTVARFGGDEFAVLLEDISTQADAARVAERILESLHASVDLDGQRVFVGASIGIAIGDGSRGSEELMRDADLAMYMAKNAGKGRYELFEEEMHVQAQRRLQLEQELRRAVEERQFVLHYQPIVDLETGRIRDVEALVRWQREDGALVPPNEFIPLAEETGLIIPLGRWVLREACAQVAAWQQTLPGAGDLGVAVNISARQLGYGDVVADVARALGSSGLAPHHLTLEVTESSVLGDDDDTLALMRDLKSLGVRLAVDDFGTGYSALSYLQRYPFDVLKIDRSFVHGLTDGSANPGVLRALVELGTSLSLTTVAEGIEHMEQLRRFRSLDCQLGQGFLFARPLTPTELGKAMGNGIVRLDASVRQEA